MSYSILLALTVSCLLVFPGTADVVDDAIDGVKDGYEQVKDTVEGNNEPGPIPTPGPGPIGNDTQKPPVLNSNNDKEDLTYNNGVTNTQDDEDVQLQSNNGLVYCWECTIEKSMDNRVISMYDETEHSNVEGATCKNHQCQSNEDWCLVTYYRIRAVDGDAEGKRERHECGNRNNKDTDTRCQQLLMDDKGHNKIVPRTCKTERSDSSSIHSFYSVYLSALLSLLSLLILH